MKTAVYVLEAFVHQKGLPLVVLGLNQQLVMESSWDSEWQAVMTPEELQLVEKRLAQVFKIVERVYHREFKNSMVEKGGV